MQQYIVVGKDRAPGGYWVRLADGTDSALIRFNSPTPLDIGQTLDLVRKGNMAVMP